MHLGELVLCVNRLSNYLFARSSALPFCLCFCGLMLVIVGKVWFAIFASASCQEASLSRPVGPPIRLEELQTDAVGGPACRRLLQRGRSKKTILRDPFGTPPGTLPETPSPFF